MNKILERAYENAKALLTERQDEVGEIPTRKLKCAAGSRT